MAENFSQTIEKMLDLNGLLTKRTGDQEPMALEGKFDFYDYDGKKNRGMDTDVYDRLLETSRNAEESEVDIVEMRFNEKDKSDGGHDPNEPYGEARGHKYVTPIWLEVYNLEDERNKIDTGQLSKKLKEDKNVK